MKARLLLVLSAGVLAMLPAHAHQGDHAHFDLAGLIAHVFETDHIIFAGIVLIMAVLAYRAGRRAEARAHAKRENGDGR